MAKVVSWKIEDKFVYIGTPEEPSGAVVKDSRDDELSRALADKWRPINSLSTYQAAFDAVKSVVSPIWPSYIFPRDAEYYFDVLSNYGTYVITGRDGEVVPDSGASYYNIHITNQNLAIGLGGDYILDKAVTATTQVYIEHNNDICNERINSITVEGVTSTAEIGETYCTVKFAIPSGTSFDNPNKNINYNIVITADDFTGKTVFTVTGIKQGEEGSFYNLIAIPNIIKKYSNGGYSDDKAICNVVKNGVNVTDSLPTGLFLKYSYTTGGTKQDYPSTGVSREAIEINGGVVYFWLTDSNNKVVDFDNCTIVADGANGESLVTLELDNEIDAISLGSDTILDVETTIGSGLKLYSGSTQLGIAYVKINGLASYEKVACKINNEDIPYDESKGGYVYNPGTPENDLAFELILSQNYTFPNNELKESALIEVKNSDGVAGTARFGIVGVKGGADGEVFRVRTSVDEIICDTNNGNQLMPGEVTCSAYTGTEPIVVGVDGFWIGYSINNVFSVYDPLITAGTVCNTFTSGDSTVSFYLIKDNVILDRESVPILRQGKDADGIVYMELLNEMDAVSLGGDNVLDTPTDTVIEFTVYSASTQISFTDITLTADEEFDGVEVDFESLGNLHSTIFSGDTAVFEDVPNDGAGIITLHLPSGFEFDDTQKKMVRISALLGEAVTVNAIYSIVGLKNGADGVVYRLLPSVNTIKYNPNTDEYNIDTIYCSAYVGENEIEFEDEELNNGIFAIRYTLNGVNDSWISTDPLTIDGVDIDSEVTDSVVFYLFANAGTEEMPDWVLIDRETIPVIDDGKNADSVYVLDLDNQNASVNCDINGNILPGAVKPSCKATLYYGSLVLEDAEYTLYSSNTAYTGISIDSSGNITISNDLNFEGTTLCITVKGEYNGISAATIFNLSKNYPGADGTAARTYWLDPSTNSIHINANNIPEPAEFSCSAWVQEGEETPSAITLTGDVAPLVYISYGTTVAGVKYTGNTIPVTAECDYDFICFKLADTANSIQYDIETIPIVRDGVDGKDGVSPYILDIDNQNVSLNCDADGEILSGATKPSCKVTLFYGPTVVPDAVYSIVTGSTGYTGIVINQSTGEITIQPTVSFDDDKLTLTIKGDTGTYSATVSFNISKNVPGKNGEPAVSYWLEPSMSSIPFESGETRAKIIFCNAWKQVGEEEPVQIDLDGIEPPLVYYALNTTDRITQYTGGSISVSSSDRYIYFKLADTANSIQYDVETVPVVKDGAKGNDGTSPYTLNIDNQNVSLDCDENGNILTGATMPSSKVQLYHGSDAVQNATYSIVTATTGYTNITINQSTGVITIANNVTIDDDKLTLTLRGTSGSYTAETCFNISKNIRGKQGANGKIIRKSVWAPHIAYYNGKDVAPDGNVYLDIVTDKSIALSGEQIDWKVCIRSHTSIDDIDPEGDIPITSGNPNYWEVVTNVGPLATPLLLAETIDAEYINVDTLDVNKLKVKDGTEETSKVILYAGDAEIPLICGRDINFNDGDVDFDNSNINSWINADGSIYSKSLHVSGGTIGGWNITENSLFSSNNGLYLNSSDSTIIVQNSDNVPLTTISGVKYNRNDLEVIGSASVNSVGDGSITEDLNSYGIYEKTVGVQTNAFTVPVDCQIRIDNVTAENLELYVWPNDWWEITFISGEISFSCYLWNTTSGKIYNIRKQDFTFTTKSEYTEIISGTHNLFNGSVVKTVTAGKYKICLSVKINVYQSTGHPSFTGQTDGFVFSYRFTNSTTVNFTLENEKNIYFGNGLINSFDTNNMFLIISSNVLQRGAVKYTNSLFKFVTSGRTGLEMGVDWSGASTNAISYFRIKVNNSSNWTTLMAPTNKLPERLRIGNCTYYYESQATTHTISASTFAYYKYFVYHNTNTSAVNTVIVTLPKFADMRDGEDIYFYYISDKLDNYMNFKAPSDHSVVYTRFPSDNATIIPANSTFYVGDSSTPETFSTDKYFIHIVYLKFGSGDGRIIAEII